MKAKKYAGKVIMKNGDEFIVHTMEKTGDDYEFFRIVTVGDSEMTFPISDIEKVEMHEIKEKGE